MRRDRKGRFSLPPKSPAYIAEQALLVRVREALREFGADIPEGMANERYGVGASLWSMKTGLREQIEAAVAPLVPAGREFRAFEPLKHFTGRYLYSVRILPKGEYFLQATPAAPSLGGPREVSA